MNFLSNIVTTILSFKPYVMLPLIMLILSMIIRMNFSKAVKSCITLGIGFIGIFIVFDFFVSKIAPALNIIIKNTGLKLNVLDVGWPPLAGIAWSFSFVPLIILLVILVNIIMIVLKKTNTINIDIWNFWHFIFIAQLIYEINKNIPLAICAALVSSILCLKLSDWSAKHVEEFSGMKGIGITTLSGVSYFPVALVLNSFLNKVPVLKDLKADPKTIKNKLGLIGEPMFIGLIMGLTLGVVAGYPVKDILELAFSISAVVFILPRMTAILGEGLIPMSSGMKEYILNKYPNMKDAYIGLDVAVVVGNPAVIVTGILMMPIAIGLALTLPNVKFIPLGDLPNMMGAVAMIVVACKGNIVRSIIVSIPVIIGKLYAASAFAAIYTELSVKAHFAVNGYSGLITSFLDGGNLMRAWIVELFTGKLWAIILIPLVAYLLYKTKKASVEETI